MTTKDLTSVSTDENLKRAKKAYEEITKLPPGNNPVVKISKSKR